MGAEGGELGGPPLPAAVYQAHENAGMRTCIKKTRKPHRRTKACAEQEVVSREHVTSPRAEGRRRRTESIPLHQLAGQAAGNTLVYPATNRARGEEEPRSLGAVSRQHSTPSHSCYAPCPCRAPGSPASRFHHPWLRRLCTDVRGRPEDQHRQSRPTGDRRRRRASSAAARACERARAHHSIARPTKVCSYRASKQSVWCAYRRQRRSRCPVQLSLCSIRPSSNRPPSRRRSRACLCDERKESIHAHAALRARLHEGQPLLLRVRLRRLSAHLPLLQIALVAHQRDDAPCGRMLLQFPHPGVRLGERLAARHVVHHRCSRRTAVVERSQAGIALLRAGRGGERGTGEGTGAGRAGSAPVLRCPTPQTSRLCPALVVLLFVHRMQPSGGGERRALCRANVRQSHPSST